ncbi:type II toxin-antitoxin system PemK/MazF family toxin [Streptomyces liangshanensis]|uniref:Type II toxin-antitoxin system PemK/MazF family toxin n=1 Tax=Streptomyces liangshanensis TaxID=2717324 RepID=A0A6G9H273_9ACTN|nr:type II toxin-antitoxin system PemK/MazF family toxin [Streptomyces liangshanensis]QIQ04628.1 type II toxin-antitoxin system PemK/MazF family toxin [Streptomyces liangshanensis]
MNTTWWIVLVVVVALALIASVVDGWGRGPRPRRGTGPGGRTRPPGGPARAPKRTGRPVPGEVWWATVPFEDGPGSKDRPCLVLSVRGNSARVAKITTKRHDGPGVILLPPDTVGDAQGRRSYLETGELRSVRLKDFRRRASTVDPALWERVRDLTG